MIVSSTFSKSSLYDLYCCILTIFFVCAHAQSLSCVQLFLWPCGLYPARLLRPWDFLGKNTGMSCYFLLQWIFLTQGLNPRLLHWQPDSLPLSHLGSPSYFVAPTVNILHNYGSVQSLSRVRLFATPWIAARQASLSITNSRSSLKLMSIELVMPSSHLILFRRRAFHQLKLNCAALDSFSDVAWAFQLHILALTIFSLLNKNRSILNLLIMSFSQIARKLIILVNCPLGVLSIPECEHFHVWLPFFPPHKVQSLYLAWYAAKLRKLMTH